MSIEPRAGLYSRRRINGNKPKKIIIATPVASKPAIKQLASQVDDFVCLMKPKYLGAVDLWYEDFTQTKDREVCDLLARETHKILAGIGKSKYDSKNC